MLRPMYAVLAPITSPEGQKGLTRWKVRELHSWPNDTMQRSQDEVRQLAASVDFALIQVVSPDKVPEESE